MCFYLMFIFGKGSVFSNWAGWIKPALSMKKYKPRTPDMPTSTWFISSTPGALSAREITRWH